MKSAPSPCALIVALLCLSGCFEDESTSHGGSPTGGTPSGGGTPPPAPPPPAPPPAPPPGGGGGPFVSTGPAPAFWDSDMPLSTTYHAPTVSSGQVYWKLISASYYPPGQSSSVGGDHHIYFQAKDFNGAFLEGQQGMAQLFDNQLFAVTKAAIDQYKGDIPMYGTSWCTPSIDTSAGPYSFKMTQGGLPSYRVDGMGLHCNHHMTWWLMFQKAIAP